MTKMQVIVDSPPEVSSSPVLPAKSGTASLWQMARFVVVGTLNTVIDVASLNVLLWCFPTHTANLLLLYNSLAYTLGALNSFVLNKYWTFRFSRVISGREILRFATVAIGGFLCNDSLIWIVGTILHPLVASAFLWANLAKASAAIGTACLSYMAMRFWVFAHAFQQGRKGRDADLSQQNGLATTSSVAAKPERGWMEPAERSYRTGRSLSVILPAHNEEAVIARTLYTVIRTLTSWVRDFEIIVVNDGSQDRTGLIVEELASVYPRVRLVTHPVNQGYGSALASGFKAVTRELVFFMDADGQFDIRDLERFFPLIERYDAVLGYWIDRQDTWIRRVNAWGWKMVVRAVLGLRVRDIDCAFKLYRADFFREYPLETRGAMINAEILYKFTRAGYTYTEVGTRHLPRRAGRATGARPSVVLRALRELILYSWKWRYSNQ